MRRISSGVWPSAGRERKAVQAAGTGPSSRARHDGSAVEGDEQKKPERAVAFRIDCDEQVGELLHVHDDHGTWRP